MKDNVLEKVFGYFASFFSGMPVTVSLIDDKTVTGYATRNEKEHLIVISTTHPLFVKGLTATERAYVQYGVLTHETLHLMLSDFDAMSAATQKAITDARKGGAKNPAMYGNVMHDIINIVEDTRIENAAYSLFGGKALRALNHCIKHSWEASPGIDEDILPAMAERMALQQVLNALIQVGDRGSVKGKFLTDTATNAFRKVLPLFNQGVMASTGAECVNICKDIYNILLPLIDATDAEPTLSRSYKDGGSGNGQPIPTSGDESPMQKRRKTLEKKMEEDAENEKSKESAKSSSTENAESDDSDPTSASQAGDEPDSDSEETDAKGSGSGEEDEQTSDDETTDSQSGAKCEDSTDADGEEQASAENGSDDSDTDADSAGKSSSTASSEDTEDADTEDGDDNEDLEQLKDDIKEFAKEVKDKEQEIKAQEEANAAKAQMQKKDMSDRTQSKSAFGTVPIFNEMISYSINDKAAYERVVSSNASQIAALTATLSRVFKGDTGGKSYHSSGSRINIKRASSPICRPTIMQKRVNPKDLKDMAIFVLIDNSGSMWGLKEEVARNASICLCECFEKLKIPFAACGFTVDDCNDHGTRRHRYFKTWRSPAAQKYALSKVRALEGNDDARAINAATDSLGKVSAKHKLLFVLSDGYPTEATQDETKQAVDNARQKGITVVSCAIGLPQSEYPVYAHMYGKDYVMVYALDDVFAKTGEMIKNAIKSW